jgi:glutaredoxin
MRDTRLQPEHRQALIARTGRTQVPCLFIDGEPMFESEDIVEWLEAYAARA